MCFLLLTMSVYICPNYLLFPLPMSLNSTSGISLCKKKKKCRMSTSGGKEKKCAFDDTFATGSSSARRFRNTKASTMGDIYINGNIKEPQQCLE